VQNFFTFHTSRIMSSLEVKGKLIVKFNAQQVTERFKKREFVLEIPSGNYTEQVKFQLIQDKCELLDKFREGDEINVHFNLKGKPYTKDGITSYFNNLDAWRIEAAKDSKSSQADEAPLPDEFASFSDSSGNEEGLPF
jgi:single-strand DNA-binding protein